MEHVLEYCLPDMCVQCGKWVIENLDVVVTVDGTTDIEPLLLPTTERYTLCANVSSERVERHIMHRKSYLLTNLRQVAVGQDLQIRLQAGVTYRFPVPLLFKGSPKADVLTNGRVLYQLVSAENENDERISTNLDPRTLWAIPNAPTKLNSA